jgi:hypothetical protein
VNFDNQTLILAGEAIPRRGDFTGNFSAVAVESTSPLKTLTAHQHSLLRSSPLSSRGSSFNAANEYARTQDLSSHGVRTAIIDTYA